MWTHFHDMHSGGGAKLWKRADGTFFHGGRMTSDDEGQPMEHIFIEAPRDEATVIFYNRFGRNPNRVTCACCGDDYSLSEEPTLEQATGFYRNCKNLETPRTERGLYQQPDDPWFKAHYYLEPQDEAEAVKRGFVVEEMRYRRGDYMTVAEYTQQADVLIIRASEIQDSERVGEVPEEGYVWK